MAVRVRSALLLPLLLLPCSPAAPTPAPSPPALQQGVGAAPVTMLQASCSNTHDCSARLRAALTACRANRVASCEVVLEPPGALFRMEQAGAVTADGLRGLAIRGNGARLLLNGDAPFLNAHRCVGLSLSNLTLAATRPPFTYGIVVPSAAPGVVNVSVDMRRYLLAGPGAPAWTRLVHAMHEVDPATLEPAPLGLDWIYDGQPSAALPLRLDAATSTISFPDRGAPNRGQPFVGFGLKPGSGLVMRHMLEFSKPQLDTIVVRESSDVALTDVTIHASPGMGVLAHDCTNVHLERVINMPESAGLPLAGNADALHLASCRGAVTVRGCVADRHGDDGLNIHGQYAVVQRVEAGRLTVGPHQNADSTSWGVIFAQPVFRVGDTVVVRRAAGLEVVLSSTVLAIEGNATAPPLVLTLQGRSAAVGPGDIVEPLSAIPSSIIVADSSFTNSRASGIILQTNAATVEGNTIANVSSNAIASGGYYHSFSEAPFGSDLSIASNVISRPGLGHRTATGGQWGAGGGAISIVGHPDVPNSTTLHRNITLRANTLTPLAGQPPLVAEATDGLAVVGNSFCSSTAPNRVSHCEAVTDEGNRCCDAGCGSCRPCD
eukprot:SAG22_NODE_349_length_11854_cov_8.087282_6_plen_605_part_00